MNRVHLRLVRPAGGRTAPYRRRLRRASSGAASHARMSLCSRRVSASGCGSPSTFLIASQNACPRSASAVTAYPPRTTCDIKGFIGDSFGIRLRPLPGFGGWIRRMVTIRMMPSFDSTARVRRVNFG